MTHLHGDGKLAQAVLWARQVMSTASGVRAAGALMQFPYLWHFGQWKLDLPDCTVRTIRPPQPGFTHGSPSRP